ncbi:MAG: hypothetical protein HZA17_08395, partial [Nitrospirae bacterium]|nr:hypothetical protein [Nitrospirota bacterium]
MSSDFAICTIVSKNYLPFARVVAESFFQHNRGEAFVLLVDSADGYFDPSKERFTLIEIETLRDAVPDFDRFCFQYTILELNTAIKPYLIEYLFNKYNLRKLIYFDPDILITNSLDRVLQLLDTHSIILTPHLTAPITDTYKPGEIDILLSGSYNLGFIALSNSPSTFSMISWWQKRLYSNCIHAVEKGLFVDQKWMDLVPGMYEDVLILREPGYNVAYWNFHCRAVEIRGKQISVNGEPAYFFHFSGFDPENMEPVSKHQNRYKMSSMLKDIQSVFREYRDRLLANGYKECKSWSYAFGCFSTGEKIPELARRLYLSMGDEVKKFGNPFSTGEGSYFEWLNARMDSAEPPITRLMYEIYNVRNDVQKVYPDIFGSHREGFVAWALTSGKKEYGLSDSFFRDVIVTTAENAELSRKVLYLSTANTVKEILKKVLKRLFWRSPRIIEKLKTWNKKLNV